MMFFVDTSALMAVMIAADEEHEAATRAWADMMAAGETLVTTNYVALETCALLQRRHGMQHVQHFRLWGLPALRVRWITPEHHEVAFDALVAANRRDLSLVDCTSFVVMRELGVTRVFALDPHFAEQGFEVVPGR